MALINCPECNRQVSDKAESCPNCGYPLQNRSVMGINADVLSGHRWKVQSETLGTGRTLVADFTKDGKFTGILQVPPGDIEMRSQQINGKWHVAQLFCSLRGTGFGVWPEPIFMRKYPLRFRVFRRKSWREWINGFACGYWRGFAHATPRVTARDKVDLTSILAPYIPIVVCQRVAIIW